MPSIADIRSQYPQYNDMSDQELAGALHQKFYADIPEDQFYQQVGVKHLPASQPGEPLWKSAALAGMRMLPGGMAIPEGQRMDAAREAFTSGLMLGGKNEIEAGASAIPALVQGGPQQVGAAFHQNLGALDQRDASMRKAYPATYGTAATGGALAGAALLPEAAGLKGAALDAGIGGASGFLSTDGDLSKRALSGAIGTVGGALIGATTRGLGKGGGGGPAGGMAVPTLDELKTQASGAYEAIKGTFKQKYAQDLANRISAMVEDRGGAPLYKTMSPMADRIQKVVNSGAVTVSKLDKLRSQIAEVADPKEWHLAKEMRSAIGDAIDTAAEKGVLRGASADVGQALQDARNLYARMKKTEKVTKAVDSGKLAAESQRGFASKAKVAQAQRVKLKPLIDPKSPQQMHGLSPEETKAFGAAVGGTKGQKLAASVGMANPLHNALTGMAGVTAGFATHGMSVPLSIAGLIGSRLEGGMATKSIQRLLDTVALGDAARTPAGKEIVADTMRRVGSGSIGQRQRALAEGMQRLSHLAPRGVGAGAAGLLQAQP